ncbi:MAG: class I SAM-dependent methyltransferase [Candidatus Marsarchaeota archaeon]|jgi:hypothetical protein|nr:class I SAM-dependent methyltransferase [Candidatus Marsarchaeota archaeon]
MQKNKPTPKKTERKVPVGIKYLINSELAYLKKEQILLNGSKNLVLKSLEYFYGKNKKPKMTLLAFSKSEIVSLLNSTAKFKGLRYVIAKSSYTGLPEQEFGLIMAFGVFDRLGSNKSIAVLKEFYRITKPNGIVIVTGNSINGLLKRYNNSNFQKAEIIEYKGMSYLKLVKLNEISMLPQ